MRVFVTGATGYIGSAVVKALVRAGHEVTGLVRSSEKEAALQALGGRPLRGDMREPDGYRNVAAAHDACIHIGFENSPEAVGADHKAIETLLHAAQAVRTLRIVVYTSGVLVLGNTGDSRADENASTAGALAIVAWRPAHERLTLDAANTTLSTAVIRPGFVYGGRKGLVAPYFESATREGAAAYVGDGKNRMSLVHRDDLAELYRLVVERQAHGIFHGVDGAAPRVVDLARAASEAAAKSGATRSITVDQAREMMGPFAEALCTDQVVVTMRSVELGWKTSHRSLPEGMPDAFKEWREHTAQ